MDERRFDQLSRQVAGFSSRRQAIKALAGVLLSTVAGRRAGAAQSCTAHYTPCQGDDQCCSGAVCQWGICMPGCRIAGQYQNAWTPEPGNPCARCTPELSTTAWSSANDGVACWNGDLCSLSSTCQAGACRSVNSRHCPPLTPCHAEGTCNPATGLCSNPPSPAGTSCGGVEMCHGGFYSPGLTCDGNGFCTGGPTRDCAPYRCAGASCATSCQHDADCATGAHCDDNLCFWNEDLGAACDEDSDCISGICAQEVCCDTRCDQPCRDCSEATGGRCSPRVCDDGLSCTTGTCNATTDQCEFSVNAGRCLIGGVCYRSGDVNPLNACQSCQPGVNRREWSTVDCEDGLTCTSHTCDPDTGCAAIPNPGFCAIAGRCYGDDDLNPANPCELCDSSVNSTGWSAVVCDDGLTCTNSACAPGGTCVHPIAADKCLIDNTCYDDGDRRPGIPCEICTPSSSNNSWSNAPQGLACDDSSLCNGREACDGNGNCLEGEPVVCAPPGFCQNEGVCNSGTGVCTYTNISNNTFCGYTGFGRCFNGVCQCLLQGGFVDCNEPDDACCPGGCFKWTTDNANCGTCGNVCPVDATCVDGTCQCASGREICASGSICCPAGATCQNDTCVCQDGRAPCNGTCCGSDRVCENNQCVCADGRSFCGGACCPGDRICQNNQCVCQPGLRLCDGKCVDTNWNFTHCGGCSTASSTGTLGDGVDCSIQPSPGVCCNGICKTTLNDPNNCGACGHVCDGPLHTGTCALGVCTLQGCPAGFGNCDGSTENGCETNLASDPNNCGACGNVCQFQGSVACYRGHCCTMFGHICGLDYPEGCCNGNRCVEFAAGGWIPGTC